MCTSLNVHKGDDFFARDVQAITADIKRDIGSTGAGFQTSVIPIYVQCGLVSQSSESGDKMVKM